MSINFEITKSAASRINELSDSNTGFRISVLGGGCSGFQYEFSLNSYKEDDDTTFLQDGASIYIDNTSLELLSDCILDYTEDLGGARFDIKNPNAKAKCGCGNSFSL